MGSTWIALRESWSAMNRCRSSGTSSLPSPALLEISHPLAAEKNSSLRPSPITSRARSESLLSSEIHHRKTCVSSSTFTARRLPEPPPAAERRSPRRQSPAPTRCQAHAARASPPQEPAAPQACRPSRSQPPLPRSPVLTTATNGSWPRARLPSCALRIAPLDVVVSSHNKLSLGLRGSVNRRVAYVSRHDGKTVESL